MKSIEASRDFKKKANLILDDRTKSQLIVELLAGLDSANTVLPALHAVSKVIIGLIRRGDLVVGKPEEDVTKIPDTPAGKYSAWLKQIFEEAWSKLMCLFSSIGSGAGAKRVQELALTTSIQIVAAIHEVGQVKNESKFWSGESVRQFRLILRTLVSETVNNSELIARFSELYLIFIDVKQYTIQGMCKMVKKCQNTKTFQLNTIKLLEGLNFAPLKNDKEEISTFLCPKSFEYEHEPVRKSFSTLWEDFMKLGHKDFEIYKRILIIVHDKVMPNLSRPLLLTDFLIESYNIGGSVSLLALNGVFSLIQNHNLEYPEFYTKLYALLTPELLHVKYRARFFHMADLFLTSTHLPEYLVAAFVKRLSRLCLTGPANALLMVLPFIGNLLLRHKGLTSLISNTCQEEDDPYNVTEPDPAKCKAVESGLWEIRSLQSHLLPQVAQAAKFINRPLPEMEWNLADFLEISMDEMMAKETKKRIFVNVPLTFERPNGLKFAKQDDLTSQLFEFA